MKYLKTLPLLLIFALVTSHSAQLSPKVAKLLAQPARPTMAEIEPLLEEFVFPPAIPIGTAWATANGQDERLDIAPWTARLLNHAPKLIAQFEKVYPGATWVFIGRDGAAFADVFEAFYSVLGEEDRVIRFGVSKGSFANLKTSDIKAMLKQSGHNAEKWKRRPPLIFIDPVSRGNGRQGRQILSMLYEDLITSHGADLKELYRKLSMIGLIVSTHSGSRLNINDPAAYYLYQDGQADRLAGHLTQGYLFKYLLFMSLDEAPDHANEAAYSHFIGAWHDFFGPAVTAPDGTVATQIGAAMPPELRMSILWAQKKIWETVRTPEFIKRVRDEAQALGLEFPKNCEQLLKAAG